MSPPAPLVAMISGAPLLAEALAAALEGLAEVRSFRPTERDIAGLVSSLSPDAVVVDWPEGAEQASACAERLGFPLVELLPRERRLRVLAQGRWEEPALDDLSVEALRNILVAGMRGRRS